MPTAHCPRCTSPAHFGPELEGRVVVCPRCRTAFALVPPPPAKAKPPADETLPDLEVLPDRPAPVPPPLPRRRP